MNKFAVRERLRYIHVDAWALLIDSKLNGNILAEESFDETSRRDSAYGDLGSIYSCNNGILGMALLGNIHALGIRPILNLLQLFMEQSMKLKARLFEREVKYAMSIDMPDSYKVIAGNHYRHGVEATLREVATELQSVVAYYELLLEIAKETIQPDRPVHKGLDPTFYRTLTYEGDVKLLEYTKEAEQTFSKLRELLEDINESVR